MTSEPLTYLVDTGWIIRQLRGRKEYTAKLDELRPAGLGVSVISVAELYEGVALAHDKQAAENVVRSFLAKVSVLAVDHETCAIFGRLSAQLRGKGQHPGDFDVMIAATAIQYGLVVLTTDIDDFSRFDGLKLITAP